MAQKWIKIFFVSKVILGILCLYHLLHKYIISRISVLNFTWLNRVKGKMKKKTEKYMKYNYVFMRSPVYHFKEAC